VNPASAPGTCRWARRLQQVPQHERSLVGVPCRAFHAHGSIEPSGSAAAHHLRAALVLPANPRGSLAMVRGASNLLPSTPMGTKPPARPRSSTRRTRPRTASSRGGGARVCSARRTAEPQGLDPALIRARRTSPPRQSRVHQRQRRLEALHERGRGGPRHDESPRAPGSGATSQSPRPVPAAPGAGS